MVRCWEADRPYPSRVGASPACLRSLAFVRMGALEEEQNRRLLRARDHIDLHYREPLDIPALASVACMSGAHFIRSFKATFGETPHRYLQRRRIERAMERLRRTDLSVSQVCVEVGWTSFATFSRTFREIVGCSPSEYRDGPLHDGDGSVPTCFVKAWTRPAGSSSFGTARTEGGVPMFLSRGHAAAGRGSGCSLVR